MTIILHVEGATPEALARGVAAAQAVFQAAKVTPWEAAQGVHARERWDISSVDDAFVASDEELAAATAWDDAEEAALKVCCDGRAIPPGAHLEVTPPTA